MPFRVIPALPGGSNKLPESVKEQCLEIALQYPEKSPRELAWYITDEHAYFISESSVYRILKSYDLITSPAYILFLALPGNISFSCS